MWREGKLPLWLEVRCHPMSVLELIVDVLVVWDGVGESGCARCGGEYQYGGIDVVCDAWRVNFRC